MLLSATNNRKFNCLIVLQYRSHGTERETGKKYNVVGSYCPQIQQNVVCYCDRERTTDLWGNCFISQSSFPELDESYFPRRMFLKLLANIIFLEFCQRLIKSWISWQYSMTGKMPVVNDEFMGWRRTWLMLGRVFTRPMLSGPGDEFFNWSIVLEISLTVVGKKSKGILLAICKKRIKRNNGFMKCKC